RRPRILFLADRNILANQAYNAFSAFPEDALVRISPKEIRKRGRVPKNGSLFFTIFQTFMTGTDGEDSEAELVGGDADATAWYTAYPADFFDFVIVDECHRGGANDESSWRGILEFFSPAVQLGLTATPKRTENADTYRYFGEPVFVYSLRDGINDGFLTPFRVRQIRTTLDEYVFAPDDNILIGEIDEGRLYREADFNRIIEIRERERKRVDIFMTQIDQREKTLVFCATQEHALVVRDLINQLKRSPDPNYCQRVTANDGEVGEQFLREFQNNERTIPTILTTSQKLSTGVDARNVRNIVLMRPVNSMIEFKQIIGRGTRLYDGKDYFTIYDFVGAHQHFLDPEWDGEPMAPEPLAERPDRENEDDAGDAEDTAGEGTEPAEPGVRRQPVKVRLADGKARNIQYMTSTSFWHPDGRPMSAQQFMELLFGKLPEFFQDEDELRRLWSDPLTRRQLLQGLGDSGFGAEQLQEMQRIIDAESSDLFDVLGYVAFAMPPITREARAACARQSLDAQFTDRQRAFLEFVLQHYVSVGVEELDVGKLSPLLRLRYHDSLQDAFEQLGEAGEVRQMFTDFQKYLYVKVP
ncbi:MAG: EcoAI/FtnUII family type I restriction enzme subunit R, partial [Planctomycetaceae bacterium]